ncbi:MAG TPA: acyltransferase, partial [Pirellulales bacterium]
MSSKRIFSLDILRGMACMLVLVAHMPLNKGIDRSTPVWRFIEQFRLVGWLGVDLFFVLSGLLISGLLFKEIQASGTIQLKRFWLRRGMKIWPAYYIMFGVWVATSLLYNWRHGLWPQLKVLASGIVPNLIFIQNYMQELQWPHTWSIAVEEHFYLALPILLVVLVRVGKLKWLPAIVGLIAIAVLAMRIA